MMKFLMSFFIVFKIFSYSDYEELKCHSSSSTQKEAASELMKYVLLKGDEKVLDIGCGNGKISAEVAQKLTSGTLIGVDISAEKIDFATNSFEVPNLCFFLKDARNLDFVKEFDLICSFSTLQWVHDHEQFLQGAYESLKVSGTLAVTMPMGPPDSLEQAVKDVATEPLWSSYFQEFSTGWNFVSKEQYTKILKENSFKIKRCCEVPQKDIFFSRSEFEEFIKRWFVYLRPLPNSLKPIFLEEVVDRFLEKEEIFPNGEVHFKTRRLEVIAVKE
jgi:trans-aconitate 2-methyltransferase